MQGLQAAIQRDAQLVMDLKQGGRAQDARLVYRRIKIMQATLQEAG